jgi:hypothetical protein
MEKANINMLIEKYNSGVADPAEIKQLELLIENGDVSLTQLPDLHLLDEQLMQLESGSPSMNLDDRFYAMLADEKQKQKSNGFFSGFQFSSLNVFMPRLAFASVLLVVGFLSGYFIMQPRSDQQVSVLTNEIADLKEMVMLSMLEKESATERLKAVNLSTEMDEPSKKVTEALIETLNKDSQVNVRLAALDALKPYLGNATVREALVNSIAHQESPMVQVSLAEVMVALQAKESVREFEKIIQSDRTPDDVKKRIEESIQTLI